MKYLFLIMLGTFGCLNLRCTKIVEKNIQKEGPNEDVTTTWRVDSLDIPICKLCDEAQLKLNLLFHNEVGIGDRIVLKGNRLLQITSNGDTLSNNLYTFKDSILSIHGSDWVDMANMIKKDRKNLILKNAQTVISEVDSEPMSNDLVIYFSKE